MIGADRTQVAIIGGGAAGLTVAWQLHARHDVTLFERADCLGGHAKTVCVEDGGRLVPLDLGFMVFNRRNYPQFSRLLLALGEIAVGDSEMSFGYFSPVDRAGYVVNWDSRSQRPTRSAGGVRDLVPELVGDILRFCRTARADLQGNRLGALSLGAYLRLRDFPQDFADRYVVAMGSAIWTTPARSLWQFPAQDFVRFFANHGLLDLTEPPQWLHIRGGSRCYVQAIASALAGAAYCEAPVAKIERVTGGVKVHVAGRSAQHFDHAVLAVHADEVLAILADPTSLETACFSAWRYERNDAVLHTDATIMPPDPSLWAAWNFSALPDSARGPVAITYYLNRLQGLCAADRSYFLTLNPRTPFPPEHVLGSYSFTHPVYSEEALSNRGRMGSLNGTSRVWYCGSYFGDGFHEDAVRSGLDVATRLECE
jgi:predicted NAD/FAD-binding protein